jgi:hypothetical protein
MHKKDQYIAAENQFKFELSMIFAFEKNRIPGLLNGIVIIGCDRFRYVFENTEDLHGFGIDFLFKACFIGYRVEKLGLFLGDRHRGTF